MKKNILFILVLSILMLTAITVSVSADQEGNRRWCFIDDDGCWITGDYGDKWYIMFWSEPIRKFYMGDSTPPYKDVVTRCRDCGKTMSLDPAPEESKPAASCSSSSLMSDRQYSGAPSPNAVKLVPIILD